MPATQESRTSTTATATQESRNTTSVTGQSVQASNAFGFMTLGAVGPQRAVFGVSALNPGQTQRSTLPSRVVDPTPTSSQESRSSGSA